MSNSAISAVYPIGYKIGHFKQSRRLVLATSQAAGPLWEFRWGVTAATGHICYLQRVVLSGSQTAAATAEELRFSLYTARTFTAIDNANVASILRSGKNQKVNGDNPDSKLTAFVESNSATAASGGTFTKDTDPLATGSYVTTTAAGNEGGPDIVFEYVPLRESEQPLRLEQDEGFVITVDAAKGATQGFNLYMEVMWAEALKP